MTDERYEHHSDQELVVMAKDTFGDDMRPFEALVRHHQKKILVNCRYLTRAPNDAEDLAQEVFVKAYLGLKRFEARSKFSTWLQRIKINHCLNFNQKRRGNQMVDVAQPGMEVKTGLYVPAKGPSQLESLDERRRISVVLDSIAQIAPVSGSSGYVLLYQGCVPLPCRSASGAQLGAFNRDRCPELRADSTRRPAATRARIE